MRVGLKVAGKIYTKVGDGGSTRTLAGESLKKNHPVIIANGKLDALQASLDFAEHHAESTSSKTLVEEIEFVQEKLWQTGGEVSAGKAGGIVKNPVEEKDVEKLEKWIDALSEGKDFKRFVRFHSQGGMKFNQARVQCREAEIALLPLLENGRIKPETFKFINRLSDFLYAVACKCESETK